MKLLSHHVLRAAVALSTSLFWLPAHAAEHQQGVVLLVHSESATDAFLQRLHQPPALLPGERFAVVKLVNGAWGDASYALVRLPKRLSVERDDLVDLGPSKDDLLANPGIGVVSRRLPRAVSSR
jgi:hypothetical protein